MAVLVMEMGLWRASASQNEAFGLGSRERSHMFTTQQLHFLHCNKLLPTLLPHQTAADVRVL